MAGLYGNSMLSFVRNSQTTFQRDYHFSLLPAVNESFCWSTSSAFGVVRILESNYANRLDCFHLKG